MRFAALRIREKVFGTRDHYMYAETEFTLAMLLSQRGGPDDARDLFRHAVDVLQAQVPSHQILATLAALPTIPDGFARFHLRPVTRAEFLCRRPDNCAAALSRDRGSRAGSAW